MTVYLTKSLAWWQLLGGGMGFLAVAVGVQATDERGAILVSAVAIGAACVSISAAIAIFRGNSTARWLSMLTQGMQVFYMSSASMGYHIVLGPYVSIHFVAASALRIQYGWGGEIGLWFGKAGLPPSFGFNLFSAAILAWLMRRPATLRSTNSPVREAPGGGTANRADAG